MSVVSPVDRRASRTNKTPKHIRNIEVVGRVGSLPPSSPSRLRAFLNQLSNDVHQQIQSLSQQIESTRKGLNHAVEQAVRVQEPWKLVSRNPERFGNEALGEAAEAVMTAQETKAGLEVRLQALNWHQHYSQQRCDYLQELNQQLEGISAIDSMEIPKPTLEYQLALRSMDRWVLEDFTRAKQQLTDGLWQTLSNLALQSEVLQKESRPQLQQFSDTLKQATQEMKSFILGIQPSMLIKEGLIEGIQAWLDARSDQKVEAKLYLQVIGQSYDLPRPTQAAISRVIQESVNNALQYAEPNHVQVVIMFGSERVSVVIKDDGIGFDTAALWAGLGKTAAMGMLLIQELTRSVDGFINLRSQIGRGTEVRTNFPKYSK